MFLCEWVHVGINSWFLTNKEEGHPKGIIGSDADVLVDVEGIEDPILPEVLMLEINHAGESLREIIEDRAADDFLVLVENGDTEVAVLEESEQIRVVVQQIIRFLFLRCQHFHNLLNIVQIALSNQHLEFPSVLNHIPLAIVLIIRPISASLRRWISSSIRSTLLMHLPLYP